MPLPKGAFVMCIAAAVLGAGAWMLGGTLVEKKHHDVRRGWNLSRVVVTSTDVSAGTTLALTQLEVREVPDQLKTSSLFTDANALVGRRTSIALPKGTPVPAGAVGALEACP
jgi:Flp pilus assembly protein CpaB